MSNTPKAKNVDLCEGSIAKGMMAFIVPLFLGQLLQQCYTLADAWVIGHFTDNDSFAAVTTGNALTFLIIGLFVGIASGGGVIVSRFFGAKDEENVEKAIHTLFLLGLIASALSTVIGLIVVKPLLVAINTPESVMPKAVIYYSIFFASVSTIMMYNVCMAIMRAVGDSLTPLYYLAFSTVVNIVLDVLFVAVFHWGITGAAVATALSQGLSAVMCIIRLMRTDGLERLDFRKLKLYPTIMKASISQGIPSGIQNSVISIGNLVVQSNINSFGAFATSGVGAYSRIESVVFLPITCMSMALPTFIGQNLGAKKYDRAKRGAAFGIICGMAFAEAIGVLFYLFAPYALRLFINEPEALAFGTKQVHITSLFFFLLAFSHCAAGVMRGCGKATVPMVSMLSFWCVFRVIYVTIAVKLTGMFEVIPWAYPITWTLSSILFLCFLLRSDWTHNFDRLEAEGKM